MEMLGDHPIGELHFDGCRVPVSARIGEEGAGMKLALSTLDVFRSTVGAAAVGMARRALEEAISYAKRRRQFGTPLAELPAVQALLADSGGRARSGETHGAHWRQRPKMPARSASPTRQR